jgi:hypothetical protein
MDVLTDKEKIELELRAAETALEAGLEGRSRVGARRAAGMAVTPYLKKKGIHVPANAVDCISLFAVQPDISPRMRQIATHLIMRVDESYQLPPDINLITEVRELLNELDATTG